MELFVELFKYIQKLPLSDLDKNNSVVNDKYTGNDYIHRKLSELFNIKFTQETAMNLMYLIKNIQLEQKEIKIFLDKMFNISEINWSNIQIPPLINNVLSFCTQKQNRQLIFEKILQFFNELRKNPANLSNVQKSDFIDAETVSILHINHLTRTDLTASKELIKIFKGKLNRNLNDLVQPFTFGLILSMIKVMSNQDGCIDLMRQIITKIYESELRYKKYYWVLKCFTEEEKKLTSQLVKPSKCRLFLSEQILPGLIKFLFDLLDNNGVRMSKGIKPVSLDEHVCLYASEMLRDLFRNQMISREEILNQLTERIFSCSIQKSMVFIDQLSILIQSEPASSFQDYFRKFKNRLDHMIYMTPIVALEFLVAIKPLLKFDSIYKDNLIITLKKSIYQSDLDVRKVGLNGLVCLLTQTKLSNFLPSSQASQSMSLSQSQSQVSRINMSQEKNSEKNCLEIFLSLRRCLTQQVEIRSRLYQSCCSLVNQNTTLIGPTLNLLLINFENYLIKTNYDIIIDYSKCLKLNAFGEIELVEPIDVLMHSLHLCDDKFTKMNSQSKLQDQIDEDIKKHSDLIKQYFEQLKQNFLTQNPQHILDTYKSQCASMILTSSKVLQPKPSSNTQQTKQTQKSTQSSSNQSSNNNNNSTELSTSMAFYQSLLGSAEILIEHFFSNGNFSGMRELFKKFNQLYDLVQKQFTNGGAEEKKKDAPKKKPSKKVKKEDKENIKEENADETKDVNEDEDDIRATAYDQSKVADITSLETNPVLESTTNNAKPKLAKKNSNKKSNMPKFNYVHRISYTCLANLLQVCYSDQKRQVKMENFNHELYEDFRREVTVDDDFLHYLMRVLNQHLDSMLIQTNHVKNNPNTLSLIYDPESYNNVELFKFLNSIWLLFWQKLSYFKCQSDDCTSQAYYCESCIKSKSLYIKILNTIWKIVSLKFNPKLNDLFSFSVFEENPNDSVNQSNSSNTSTVAVGILDQCRRFIDKCLTHSSQYIVSRFKFASQLIDFMLDISSSITLNLNDYGNLFKWTQTLATEKEISDQIFLKSLFKFFTFITWNKNSSATLMKYLCQDLMHVYGIYRDFSSYVADLSTSDKFFNCITDESGQSMISVICDELANQLALLEWFISFKSDQSSIITFYKQLNCILECLKILLIIKLPSNSPHEIIIRILSKFYNFMISFCKSIPNRHVSEEEESLLKRAVDFTAIQMQNPLTCFIRSIQNTKSTTSKDKGDKKAKEKGKETVENSGSVRGLKCSKMIPNLVYLYEQYEQQLKLLNKHFKNRINLTENFEIRLRDFEIVLSSRQDGSDDDETSYSPRPNRNDETTRNGGDNDDDDDEEPTGSNVNESEEEMDDD
ncbi:unnamed protein product [Brachionus calyciflorus]|uniref:Fanconi anemia group I protein n=1 Tax=Brachionus calyciflorus TaxID=104777 RepID=A0A813ZI31_9BILA|nr:unnamed protein product [Brachionus calyciflorus]